MNSKLSVVSIIVSKMMPSAAPGSLGGLAVAQAASE
jgi:hypothetical protein